MSERLVVLMTAGSQEEADKIANALVTEMLAACVNVVPGVESHYWWEGAIQNESESLLVIKTTANKVEELTAALPEIYPYDVPELLAIPVEGGSPAYLAWLRSQ